MGSGMYREGFVPFRGYRTFYKIAGDLDKMPAGRFPVLALHGRPVSHESLQPLTGLAESGRPVVFYDQLGCGRSDRPDEPSVWDLSLFADEVDQVRRELKLDQVHLLGHSWGGVVAQEYALRQPAGLVSLTLASTYASFAMFVADVERLREALPAGVLETLQKHEAEGTTDDPAYQEADKVFRLRHIFRVDPWPGYMEQALRNPPVGGIDLSGFDTRERLDEIRLPTLITCGRHDICTPAMAELMDGAIGDSELVIFEESSHYPHGEESARFLVLLGDFLSRAEEKCAATD